MSHNTIPHTNVMIERMGKITGAWKTVFNNDLNNLRYPKIKDYDAHLPQQHRRRVPARSRACARASRGYVREGGGLGGIHGTPWASRNWDEFAEMIGAQSAPHRDRAGRHEGLRSAPARS